MALSRIGSECLIEVTNQQLKLSIHGNTERIAGIAGIHNLNSIAGLSVFPQSPFLQVKTIQFQGHHTIRYSVFALIKLAIWRLCRKHLCKQLEDFALMPVLKRFSCSAV